MKQSLLFGKAGLGLASLLLAGCILQFTGGDFQSFTLHFSLERAVPAGESSLIYTAVQPNEVKIKKRWVRVSGMLTPDGGAELPASARVVILLQDASGKRLQRLTMTLDIAEDGAFVARKKVKKNLPAGAMIAVSVEPQGAAIPAGTDVWLCVDVLESRKAAADPACSAAADGGGGSEAVVVRVLEYRFDPERVRIQAGTTVRWVLEGTDPTHTVTANNGETFDSGFIFTNPGDSFEVFFGPETQDRTFEYSCISHGPTSQMQGSVQVGDNAPAPNDRY